jgi:hypothetical protein
MEGTSMQRGSRAFPGRRYAGHGGFTPGKCSAFTLIELTRRDRDHRDPGRHPVSCVRPGPRKGAANVLLVQHEAVGTATMMYVQDYDERLPAPPSMRLAAAWTRKSAA